MSDEIKIFNLNGQVEKISTRKGDGAVMITIATQIPKIEEAGYMMMMQNKHVYFFMAEKEFQANDLTIPDEPKTGKPGGKQYSKSQILRFELFDYFRSQGAKEEELEQKYQDEMDKIYNHYKSKRKKK